MKAKTWISKSFWLWKWSYTYFYSISVFSLPTSWNVVRVPKCVVWGTISKHGLSPWDSMQFGENPESSTATFFIWVIKKSVKLCQEVELVWNYNFWMRVQNGANKTVATSRITNKQHKWFNAIVQRIALEVQFLWKEEQNIRVGQIINLKSIIWFSYMTSSVFVCVIRATSAIKVR